MMKKIISLSLCLLMLLPVLAGCSSEINKENPGAYVKMYISDPVYNFDPARAYNNESALKVISLLFDNLFILNEKGKVEKSLAKDYKIIENEKTKEYKMVITLKESSWSDGIALTANDVVFAWKRILDPSNSFDAASLLYDIKNAREAKLGNVSIDSVGIYAAETYEVEIDFAEKIDYDAFLLKLTSYALAPLRENVVAQVKDDYDWAKKATLFASSGPFKIREVIYEEDSAGLTLERNERYLRDEEKDKLDKYVTPYRLIVDYTMSDDDIKKAYKNGELFYIGDIPLSIRGDLKNEAEIAKKTFSTHTYVLNQNAMIESKNNPDGEKLFANPIVRKALSLAINRKDIAETAVFAEVATGLIPTGVFNTDSKKTSFRDEAGSSLLTSDAKAADKLLKDNNINASDYTFSISVAAYDKVHMAIAEKVQASWKALGFNVEINALAVKNNDKEDIDRNTGEVINGVKDDVFAENYDAGDFQVAAIDYTAYSVDAFSCLAPFAYGFNGGAASNIESPNFEVPTHVSGYNSQKYNDKILAAYKEKDADKKAKLLHDAEKILMEDLPVIPIIFNQTATLTSKELSKDKVSYYNTPIFSKLKLKDYENYIPEEEKKIPTKKDEDTSSETK